LADYSSLGVLFVIASAILGFIALIVLIAAAAGGQREKKEPEKVQHSETVLVNGKPYIL
jgi:hypothetical protein